MEAIIIVIFSFILLSCILAGYSIIWALLFGYLMFFGYALRQGHTPVQVLTMSGRGIRTIKNILFIFILIGMITAVWRPAARYRSLFTICRAYSYRRYSF